MRNLVWGPVYVCMCYGRGGGCGIVCECWMKEVSELCSRRLETSIVDTDLKPGDSAGCVVWPGQSEGPWPEGRGVYSHESHQEMLSEPHIQWHLLGSSAFDSPQMPPYPIQSPDNMVSNPKPLCHHPCTPPFTHILGEREALCSACHPTWG